MLIKCRSDAFHHYYDNYMDYDNDMDRRPNHIEMYDYLDNYYDLTGINVGVNCRK